MLSAATSDGGYINIFDHSLEGISEWYIRYAASLILYLVSGHRVNSTDDKYVKISESVVTGTTQCGNPGSQLVDIFPAREFSFFLFLNTLTTSCSVKYLPAWLPGMALKRHALRVHKDIDEMENMLLDEAKENMVSLARDIHETLSWSSVEIRFHDLLTRSPPRKSHSRRAGLGWRYTGYQGCCEYPLYWRACFSPMPNPRTNVCPLSRCWYCAFISSMRMPKSTYLTSFSDHFYTRSILFSHAALPRCVSQSPRGNWSCHWEWTTPWLRGPSFPSIPWSACRRVVQVCHF